MRTHLAVLLPLLAAACSSNDIEATAPQTTVAIVLGAATTSVDLRTAATTEYKGESAVALRALWTASGSQESYKDFAFDFEGDDGFRPSSKERCKALVTAEQFDRGYILPATRTLVWDDALGFPGCYAVKNVAKILAQRAAADAGQ